MLSMPLLFAAGLLALPLQLLSQEAPDHTRLSREVVWKRLRRTVVRGDAARLEKLKGLFDRAGCRGEQLTEQPVPELGLPNLVCRLPGEGEGVIVVGAHYDAHPAGEGAVDNWSGAALLASLYESLKSRPRRHTFLFVGFAGGESRHRGAKAFAKGLRKRQVRAMVNLECIGMVRPLAWDYSDKRLLARYLKMVSRTTMLPVDVMPPDKLGKSDAEPFARRGIPALTIHSVSPSNYRIRRDERDIVEAIRENEYYETYALAAAYLAFLDANLP